MRPEDWQVIADRRRNWREADLHDLRLRYAALLLSVSEHRRAILSDEDYQQTVPDGRLWSVLDEERF